MRFFETKLQLNAQSFWLLPAGLVLVVVSPVMFNHIRKKYKDEEIVGIYFVTQDITMR